MSSRRVLLGLAVLAYAAGVALLAVVAAGDELALVLVGLLPAFLLGLLVAGRRPDSPVGPALVALAAAPALTSGLEQWGNAFVAAGVWVFNLAGFVLLCLVFPTASCPVASGAPSRSRSSAPRRS